MTVPSRVILTANRSQRNTKPSEHEQARDCYVREPSKKLAEGGVVKSPTRALIGEGGEPEVVLPQSKMAKVTKIC